MKHLFLQEIRVTKPTTMVLGKEISRKIFFLKKIVDNVRKAVIQISN